ncbi:phosphoglycerate mutase-like protein [Meredithblackwellia eburnea MCA 4105]
MSFPGQTHHPHPAMAGVPPNSHLITPEGWLPNGLQLVQAHWFVRHGERSPVRKRLVGFGDIPAIFPLCATGRAFKTAVLGFGEEGGREFEGSPTSAYGVNEMNVRRLSEDQGVGNEPRRGRGDDCYWGELTDLGRRSTHSLGVLLRSLYVTNLSFLPASLPPPSSTQQPTITFRSTGMPRTIESLHQVVEGLFPAKWREGGSMEVEYTVRTPMEESLYPNSLCLKMRKLDRQSADQAAKTWNPTLMPLDSSLSKFIGGNPIRIDGHPRANGILDTVMVCRAHGIKVPKELEDPNTLEILERSVVHEWFDAYANPEFKKLSMGRLLGDLGASLDRKVADPKEEKEKLRLAVYSCHDTSLGGILNSLNIFDGRWPPFTSHIAVELFRPSSPVPSASTTMSFLSLFAGSAKPKEQHYVRLKYNGRTMALPACREEGKHLPGDEGVCTFEAFREAVRGVEISAKEWEKGCEA